MRQNPNDTLPHLPVAKWLTCSGDFFSPPAAPFSFISSRTAHRPGLGLIRSQAPDFFAHRISKWIISCLCPKENRWRLEKAKSLPLVMVKKGTLQEKLP
jgi:hypothetical protein